MRTGYTNRRAGLRRGLGYAVVFGGPGAVQSFAALWLQSRGLGVAEIGPVLGATLCVRLAVGPLIGVWAERFAHLSTPLARLCLAVAIAASLSMLCPGLLLPILLGWSLPSICCGACTPLLDAANLQGAHRRPDLFCWPRLAGAAATLVGSLAFGVAATLFGIGAAMPVWSLASGLGAAWVLWRLGMAPADPERAAAQTPLAATGTERAGLAMLALAASILVQASHGFNALLMLDWHAQGRSALQCALLWQIGPVADIALFWLLGRIATPPATLLALAAAAATLRWIGYALSPSLWMICLLQTLHALSATGSYIAAVQLVDRMVPPHRRVLAQVTSWAMLGGVAKGLVTLASGPIGAGSTRDGYWIMALLAAAGLLLSLVLTFLLRHSRDASPDRLLNIIQLDR